MTEPEAAWVGAFIEADGSVCLSRGRKAAANIAVTQKDIEPISALLRLTGVGRVYLDRNRIWQWVVCAQGDVAQIIQRILPYSTKAQAAWPFVAQRLEKGAQ